MAGWSGEVTTRILKHVIPVDDRDHTFQLPEGTPILAVDSQGSIDHVSFWYMQSDGDKLRDRTLRVVSTGQPIDLEWPELMYAGTAVASGGKLVWHLIEMP